MTSKEEISLQLTKTILENSNIDKLPDPATVASNIYNNIYATITTYRP